MKTKTPTVKKKAWINKICPECVSLIMTQRDDTNYCEKCGAKLKQNAK